MKERNFGGQEEGNEKELYNKAVENLKLAKNLKQTFEAKLREALGGKPETHGALRSALQFAISNDVATADTAGDYLLEVANYLQKKAGIVTPAATEAKQLAAELKGIRGKIEHNWDTKGKTPEGYDAKPDLEEVRRLFTRLERIYV